MIEGHCRRFTPKGAGFVKSVIAPMGLALFFLSSCAPRSPVTLTDSDDDATEAVISQAIGLLGNRYIDPLLPEQLTINAIEGLEAIDPEISVSLTPEDILARYGKNTVVTLPLPDDDETADENGHIHADIWAALVMDSLRTYRVYSPALRQASALEIQSRVIAGAIEGLDPYSRYENPNRAEISRDRREGYIGIGVDLIAGTGYPVVKKITENAPALKYGIHPGDQIISVDGTDLYNRSQLEVIDRLKGAPDSIAVLEINPTGSSLVRRLEVPRERIIARTVFPEIRNNVLIVEVRSFNNDTAAEIDQAIADAKIWSAGPLAGVILDLRGNRGGLLNQGVSVADAFLTSGPIGTTITRVPAAKHIFTSDDRDFTNGLPLVVLINGRTASSAELVAASLQDRGRAVLVGSTSFGKGSVQAINDLKNQGTITFTWSRLVAPSGYTFDRIGLHPAICTSEIGDHSPQQLISHAMDDKNALAKTMQAWRTVDFKNESSRAALRRACPPSYGTDKYDVDVALEVIKNPAAYGYFRQQSTLQTVAAQTID
ncbi:S41 family peptidase [Thalassospira marina]|uniref:Carboxyl-terminal protease n=1 Tax=Thalassospira marina TaxID=2048283 RepID=A0A2N3KVE2_9PROT|nr:S41 family peptidase [Thalassospira marina]PKR54470.1 carboxyl-terminal protease [Thalassospira marina]